MYNPTGGYSGIYEGLPTAGVDVLPGRVVTDPKYSAAYINEDGPVLVIENKPPIWKCSIFNVAFCLCGLALLGVLGTLVYLLFASAAPAAVVESAQLVESAYGGSPGQVDVVIGTSPDAVTKCIPAPSEVNCAENVQEVGYTAGQPETWHVYHNGNSICAQRTDTASGWTLDLVLRCPLQVEDVAPHQGDGVTAPAPANQGYTTISVGNTLDSHEATKCVAAPANVVCDDTAEQVGRTGEYTDRFHIYHQDDKICAHRLDHEGEWGLNLVLKCKNVGADAQTHYKTVTIGNTLDTKSNVKCVADPGDVHCDDTAEQVGRTGKYPDKFSIYHENNQICARRTDHNGDWGLNLILKCKATAVQ